MWITSAFYTFHLGGFKRPHSYVVSKTMGNFHDWLHPWASCPKVRLLHRRSLGGITQERVRNAKSQASPQIYWITISESGGLGICVLTSSPGDFLAILKSEKQYSKGLHLSLCIFSPLLVLFITDWNFIFEYGNTKVHICWSKVRWKVAQNFTRPKDIRVTSCCHGVASVLVSFQFEKERMNLWSALDIKT